MGFYSRVDAWRRLNTSGTLYLFGIDCNAIELLLHEDISLISHKTYFRVYSLDIVDITH